MLVRMNRNGKAGGLLLEARRRAGLTQAALAERAGVTQSMISAYETGAREPSMSTLERLVAAAGLVLDLRVECATPESTRLHGPLGRRLVMHRDEVIAAAAAHGASNVRVFGSVARAEEDADSDIDLLIDLEPDVGLFGLMRLRRELEDVLGIHVDVVPDGGLKPGVMEAVMTDALAL